RTSVALSDMLELGELERAASLIRKLQSSDPDILSYPRMMAVCDQVEIAQSKETDRAVEFDNAMREAEAAPVAAKPPPAVEAARPLARLDTEKAAVAHLLERRQAVFRAEQARQEKALGPRLDEIDRAVSRIEHQAESAMTAAAEESTILGPLAETQRALTT